MMAMSEGILFELQFFSKAFLLGAVMMILYDGVRIFRRILPFLINFVNCRYNSIPSTTAAMANPRMAPLFSTYSIRKMHTPQNSQYKISSAATEILLETEQGMLTIKGADLHVNRLTLEKGEVDIEGRIDSMAYSEVADFQKAGASNPTLS